MGDTAPLSPDLSIGQYIIDKVNEWQEPLGLQGWQIHLEHGAIDSKGGCVAEPEYKRMVLSFNLDRLETGDELDEIIAHEMMHGPTWPLWETAEQIMHLALDLAPPKLREPLKAHLSEQIRYAGEDVTTQVGFTAIRLLRRLAAIQGELANSQAEVKALKRQLKALDKSAHMS